MGGLDLVLEFGALWLHPTKLKIPSPSPNQRLITKAANDPFIWLATESPGGHSALSTGLLYSSAALLDPFQKREPCPPA